MLTTLRIKNLALVEDLTVELQAGYNVITGETGAGKSILIGALSLALGERADRTLLRNGSDACTVEAVFDISRLLRADIPSFLAENGIEPCEEDQLVLKRTFSSAGTNRQFINGSPTSLNTLAALGEWLVDIHGPHEHQSLLHPARQLAILDAFGKLEVDREALANLVRLRESLEAEKAILIVDEKTYQQQLDLLRFQVQEITAAELSSDEEETIEQDYHRASNSAKLLQLGQAAMDGLSESETSLLNQAGIVGRALQDLRRIDPGAEGLVAMHEQALGVLRELQTELSAYADKIELNPSRLQELEERLNLIHTLKRKYGASLWEVISFGQLSELRLRDLEQRDVNLVRLNSELDKVNSELWRAGQALSAKRRKIIPQLSKAVSKQLSDLGFKQSQFDVSLISATKAADGSDASTSRVTQSGLDAIEFQFAPNPGEPMQPLRAIASSGELARVMLALKTVLADEDSIPVLVFDEVDANVGGETANVVGEKMRQIARQRQVLCITHLPQVAASASAHYVAKKQVKAGRTISEITRLDAEARVTELARMLGGQSAAARKHAEALLKD